MAEQQQEQPKQRTAGERIQDLENALMGLYQALDNMSRDMLTIKEAIKLLGNKLDSVAKAANISDDVISKLMVENNVAELKKQVEQFVAQGVLKASTTITDSSFVIGQEIDQAGNVLNPRIQFILGSMKPEVREAIKAGGIGQAINLGKDVMQFLLLEVYDVIAPQAPQAPDAQGAAPTAPAPAADAPAADAPATDASAPAASASPVEAPAADPSAAAPAAPQSSSDASASAPQSSGSN